ncbi:MAG TPA: acetyl-CoA carboxylase biotin carboxyl carrier protein [Bryobacteraceae bacterium]|nr:acetyl-CoA carboxylase biotin carboxyl carrier protein [Bryobacteraceae bacterium]
MTIEEIRELIQLLTETGVAELEVQRGDNRVRIRKSFAVETETVMTPANTAHHTPAPAAPPPSPTSETPPPSTAHPEAVYAKSPIVGTFYESSSPDSPPFVQIGQEVRPGTVLCIIESMKLMNEIEAEVAGIVESRLVENGQPVEYGERLFAIRPL